VVLFSLSTHDFNGGIIDNINGDEFTIDLSSGDDNGSTVCVPFDLAVAPAATNAID
jgi:hypothetical protein